MTTLKSNLLNAGSSIVWAGFLLTAFYSCTSAPEDRVKNFPQKTEYRSKLLPKNRTFFFILAGQSNMAGRGLVEPLDTIPDTRILTINKEGKWILAKEPLHYYEPTLAGLDCGLFFAKTLLNLETNDSINIVLLPAAVGGSSIKQWLGDSLHRKVRLLTNMKQKIDLATQNGILAGILWHQGESDAHDELVPEYGSKLAALFRIFRAQAQNDSLPILVGELGSFLKNKIEAGRINEAIRTYARTDNWCGVVSTKDLVHRGDSLHFNARSLRIMGERFALTYVDLFARDY